MLKDFYLQEAMREEVRLYLLKFLTDKAVQKVFNYEDTKSIAEARDVIEEAFNNLEVLFPSKSKEKELINEAR